MQMETQTFTISILLNPLMLHVLVMQENCLTKKRAPTWVLTKGLAEEESLPNKTQSPPLGMLDAITAPATETALAREEKRLLASKALYGDDHTVLDTPDSPKQSNVNVDAVQQEQSKSPKMSVSELNSSQSIALMTIVESDNEEGIEDQ